MYVFDLKSFVKYFKKKPTTFFWRNHAKCEYMLSKNSGGLANGHSLRAFPARKQESSGISSWWRKSKQTMVSTGSGSEKSMKNEHSLHNYVYWAVPVMLTFFLFSKILVVFWRERLSSRDLLFFILDIGVMYPRANPLWHTYNCYDIQFCLQMAYFSSTESVKYRSWRTFSMPHYLNTFVLCCIYIPQTLSIAYCQKSRQKNSLSAGVSFPKFWRVQ